MNKEELILEEFRKIMDSIDALNERLESIENKVDRLIAWVEKVVEISQSRVENTEGF